MLLGLWEWMGRTRGSRLTFPPISQVVDALGWLVQQAEFWRALLITLQSLVTGLGLALLVGIPLGLLMGWRRTVRGLFEVYLRLFLSMPLSPLVPLLIIIFGLGLAARASVVFTYAMPVVALNAATGVLSVSSRWVEMTRSFCATEAQLFRRVILPGAMPAVMAGIRLGTGRAVVGMVVSELIIISVGLGQLINRFNASFQAPRLFSVVVVLMVIGVMALSTVRRVEGRLLWWKQSET